MLIVNLRAEQVGSGVERVCILSPVVFIKRLTRKVEVALLVKHRARCVGPSP